ncbi:MAG TPA: UDP-glucose/GDP-mannose dehydrogenase family protein [Candidatus Dormibacteraeota bacterium]|jgi:UDPglucose 6-dehydrogenase
MSVFEASVSQSEIPSADNGSRLARDPRVAIVGGGYVGLALAAHLVTSGHAVDLVEIDRERRLVLQEGRVPVHEPGLDSVLEWATKKGLLQVTADLAAALDASRMVFVAVGTPPGESDEPDLRAITAVAAQVRACARPGTVLVIKSTVPPGTGRRIQGQLHGPPFTVPVVSCPEFLREGSALHDMRAAPRHVIGGEDREAMRRVEEVVCVAQAEVVMTDWTSAELIKYGSNSFLALKISFVNELARFAEAEGADITQVAYGMGLDPRIGAQGMRAGLGFGGSCFPKDVRALIGAGDRHGIGFAALRATMDVNHGQRALFVEKIRRAVGGTLRGTRVAVLGLAFKPCTDDMREACSLDVIQLLLEQGCRVAAHDPCASSTAEPLLPAQVMLAADPYSCVLGADAAAVVTEWPEYVRLDWARARSTMRRPVLVDGRNCLNPAEMARLGFQYHSVGRPPCGPRRTSNQHEAPTEAASA